MSRRDAQSDSAKIGSENKPVQVFRSPVMDNIRRVEIERAALRHSIAHRSDPFAQRRAITHMRRGIELPSEVLKDADSLIAAHNNEHH